MEVTINFSESDIYAIRKFTNIYDNDNKALEVLPNKIVEVVQKNQLSVETTAGVFNAWVQDEDGYQQAGVTFTPKGFNDIIDGAVVESKGENILIKSYGDIYDEMPTSEITISRKDIEQALS